MKILENRENQLLKNSEINRIVFDGLGWFQPRTVILIKIIEPPRFSSPKKKKKICLIQYKIKTESNIVIKAFFSTCSVLISHNSEKKETCSGLN